MFPTYIFKYHYFITNTVSSIIVISISLGCINWQLTPSNNNFLYSSSGAADPEKLKKNLTGCRLCRAGNQISVFHATFYTRVKAGSCPAIHHIHPGALPGCSWKKTGHRQEPEQPLGQEAVSVSAQVLALTSPEHHFEVCQ